VIPPVVLAANQPPKFYRGGARIAAFRRSAGIDEDGPPYRSEDWLGSTVSNFGTDVGATVLPNGQLLRDAIAADPVGFLGAEHVGAMGANSGLLLKLLDAGERLPVHCHPSRAFAHEHLGSVFGKTEAWIVLATDGDEGYVYLGFRDVVGDETLRRWFTEQPSAEMLAAMNRISVRAGDAILVQAGMPHAIGAGIFILELQEPTDFSVMLEWKGFGLDAAFESQLGLEGLAALACMDRSAWSSDRLESRFVRRGVARRDAVDDVLPDDAGGYFRALSMDSSKVAEIPAGYSILVVLEGDGSITTGEVTTPVSAGSTVLIPFGAGNVGLHGDFFGVRCLPPDPAAFAATER
jgi:mannose-6-phosphate isomerase